MGLTFRGFIQPYGFRLICLHSEMSSGGNMFFDSGTALLRTLVVGCFSYIVLVSLLRVSGKRTLSKWNAFDLVITVALGSTLATAILSKDTSLAQGVTGFLVLVVLQWIISWFCVRSAAIKKWVNAQPRVLLLRGQWQIESLRQERVTESEVLAALRARGITDVESVEAVVLETDGSFSIIQEPGKTSSTLADVAGYPGGDCASRPP